MVEEKSENMIGRVVFALFLPLVFSLGFMKPGIDSPVATLTPTDLVFPVLFLAWLVAIATRQLRFVWHPAFIALAIYFSALAVSAIFSSRPRLSFAKLAGELYLLLLPVVTVSVVTSVERLKQTLWVWVAGAVVPLLIGLLGIVLYYFAPSCDLLGEVTYHYGSVPVGNYPRLSSTFVSASMFCNYLTVTFAIVGSLRWTDLIKPRAAFALMMPLIVCAAYTVSIALGGFLLAGGLLVWNLRREPAARYFGLSLAITTALAFLLISPFAVGTEPTGDRSVRIIEGVWLNPSSRAMVWDDAASHIIKNPFVGSGVGTPVASVTVQNTDGTASLLTDAHNMFLNVAGQAGLIGLGALLFVIWAVLQAGYRGNSDELSAVRKSLVVAFVAAFLYDGLTGSFEDARHLWVLIGLILAVDSLDS